MPQAQEQMKQKSIMAHVAAIQNGVSLSNGEGLMYEWNDETDEPEETERYEGSLVA